MPSNLKDYMSKNNISNSSRGSFEYKRYPEEEKYQERDNRQELPNKFSKSKNQCIEELSQIINQLDKKQAQLKKAAEVHNHSVIKKFNEEYDTIAQQIIRQVELHLRDSKERFMKEIKDRRASELAEAKPIRRNIQKLREQVTTLRQGLYRENQYRQYISKIVLKDFESELSYIQTDIHRVRFPGLEVRMDDKYYSCFKNDLDKLIMVRDEMNNREYLNQQQSQSQHHSMKFEDINSHSNRDQIKRTQVNKFA